ncbi:MAG: cytochrome c [Chlorobiaceae bacterium]|jgi:mono/diheme cytochrome c family protein|nr:cytochrome c [Chlorobiaceae bacterium]
MQKKRTIRKTAVLAALSVLVISGCGKQEGQTGKNGQKKAEPAGAAADSALMKVPYAMKEGKRLYVHYCSVCHGESGDGAGQYYGLTPTPANFTDKAFMKTLSDERLLKAISDGSVSVGKSNMCPPWGKSFEQEELEFIVAYIKTFSGQ